MSKLVGTLGKIEEALASFKLPVWYGKTFCKSDDKWNYFVFNKKQFNRSGKSKIDFNYDYQVHIIMENYIEEGFEQKVIKKIKENTNLKLIDQPMQFNYVKKNNTNLVVEILTLEFTKTFKGCDING
ncbi:hypothetical protein [uncultured Intestinibacter sp.]|uniref:hypothetical protein n=1 Tax=uncultured Intestinibacter sp. TaxID=1505659 RepID=UPI0027DBC0E7|nr:hypothetical protein [uncultured Intestinibacter sp.]